jgi:hypothetical protein
MASGLDPVYRAQVHFSRQQYTECVALCSELLASNPYD